MRSFMTMKGYGALMSLVEKWRDIADYKGLYQISSIGRVRSLDRIDALGRLRKGKVLADVGSMGGYRKITLHRDGNSKQKYIHCLVAETFIPNPDGLPEINHKDEDKTNNAVSNLEWCSRSYNINYGTRNERMAKSNEQTIYVVSGSGHRYYFGSIKKAAELLGLSSGAISSCLHGKLKHHHGYLFELAV